MDNSNRGLLVTGQVQNEELRDNPFLVRLIHVCCVLVILVMMAGAGFSVIAANGGR